MMFGLSLLDNYRIPGATIKAFASAYGSSANPTITLPAGITAGDTIVVFVGSNYGVSAGPTGFTTLDADGGSYHSAYLCYKVAAGTEGGTSIQATCSGSEPWNMWAVVVSDGQVFGHNGNRATSGTSLALGSASAVLTRPFIVFASARVGSKTLTSNAGTLVSARASDASLSSALFLGHAASGSVSPTIGSPASTIGISGSLACFS